MSTRPAMLGSSLDLKTLADVDAALHELGWLQQQTAQVEARTQAAVNGNSRETRDTILSCAFPRATPSSAEPPAGLSAI